MAYDTTHSKKDLGQHTGSNYGPKKGKADRDIIEGNFVVPDVFMKTKYGPTTTYNYNIKNSNQHQNDHNFGESYGTGYKSGEKNEPKKIVASMMVNSNSKSIFSIRFRSKR